MKSLRVQLKKQTKRHRKISLVRVGQMCAKSTVEGKFCAGWWSSLTCMELQSGFSKQKNVVLCLRTLVLSAMLTPPLRNYDLRIIYGYRTVSSVAADLVAGVIPSNTSRELLTLFFHFRTDTAIELFYWKRTTRKYTGWWTEYFKYFTRIIWKYEVQLFFVSNMLVK